MLSRRKLTLARRCLVRMLVVLRGMVLVSGFQLGEHSVGRGGRFLRARGYHQQCEREQNEWMNRVHGVPLSAGSSAPERRADTTEDNVNADYGSLTPRFNLDFQARSDAERDRDAAGDGGTTSQITCVWTTVCSEARP